MPPSSTPSSTSPTRPAGPAPEPGQPHGPTSAGPTSAGPHGSHRGRRRLPLLWGASALSAAVLLLGVNGTLSAWTSAVITNDTNTAATASAVILKEVGPDGSGAHTSQTCYSSSGAGNTYTCSTINKYGGISTPLAPGTNQTTDVTFTNVGSGSAATFKLAPGACSQTPTANAAATPPIGNLCGGGDLTVAVSCSDGATYTSASAWTDLVSTPTAPGSLATLTHTATLAANASWTCRFTVALGAAAPVTDQGIAVSQPLTWTLAQ